MRPFPLFASSAALCVVLLPLVTPSCGGSTSTPSTGAGGGSAGSTTSGTAGDDTSGASGTSVIGSGGNTGGSSAQGGAGGTTMTSTDNCATDAECIWGEIPKKILKATDCVCLYGCVYLPQTKVTAARRAAQYKALCDPGKDGKGQSCGIDDCALPGAIACIDGACKAAPKDGGMFQ